MQLNKEYRIFCQKNKLKIKFQFKTIREEFPNYFNLQSLHDYAGIVILPYSSFSISSLELYRLNLPYFYPSKKILTQHKPQDYILYPIYCSKDQYSKICDDINDINSPNNYATEAQDKWLNYFSGYQHKNTIVFDDLEDLFQKIILSSKDFKVISERMYLENQEKTEILLKKWQQLLT